MNDLTQSENVDDCIADADYNYTNCVDEELQKILLPRFGQNRSKLLIRSQLYRVSQKNATSLMLNISKMVPSNQLSF